MTTLFLSHGSPMHALARSSASSAWQKLAAALPKPRAVLIASAHWETASPAITANVRPETIYDFGGFPAELYTIRYDAPGDPELARRAGALLDSAGLASQLDETRGLDHGAWVPLRWMYPDADVPIVQLAVQPQLGAQHHFALGAALRPLTTEGVLIIGSGHVTHNLRDWANSRNGGVSFPYVAEFSEWLRAALEAQDLGAVSEYRERGPSGSRAHPTPEHFLPLFIAWGAAGLDARAVRVYSDTDDSLSMDAYRFEAARH